MSDIPRTPNEMMTTDHPDSLPPEFMPSFFADAEMRADQFIKDRYSGFFGDANKADDSRYDWVYYGLTSRYDLLEYADPVTGIEDEFMHVGDFIVDLLAGRIELDGKAKILIVEADE